MSNFKRASRRQARLRMAIDGPSGSGKSLTALRLAFAFVLDDPSVRVACIEAGENGGILVYQGEEYDGVRFDFDIAEIKGDYSPEKYTAKIEEAGREGFGVLVIDSLSHAWAGAGGALEMKDDQARRGKENDFTAWRTVTPKHNRMVEAILQSPCHVIATMRSKTEYVIEKNDRGQSIPKKVGMAPVQRAGMEYEFTIYGSMDTDNFMSVTKTRCSWINGKVVEKPGAGFMRPVIDWLKQGEPQPAAAAAPDQPPAADARCLWDRAVAYDALGASKGRWKQLDLREHLIKSLADRFGGDPEAWDGEECAKAMRESTKEFESKLKGA